MKLNCTTCNHYDCRYIQIQMHSIKLCKNYNTPCHYYALDKNLDTLCLNKETGHCRTCTPNTCPHYKVKENN